MEDKEKKSRDLLRIAYTQMQEAVPSSYGRLIQYLLRCFVARLVEGFKMFRTD